MNSIYQGDSLEVLKTMPDEIIDCCITSPPYWGLRDYGVEGQFGLEKTPEEYVSKMVEVFREVKRVLKKEGTLWLNLGDSYNSHSTGQGNVGGIEGKRKNKCDNIANTYRQTTGLKDKDLVGIPWRLAFVLQSDGWYLRQDIIWHKPNPMPESVTDRCTKAHEYIFLLAKSQKYYFDGDAIKEKSIAPGSIHIAKDKQKMEVMDGIVPQHNIESKELRNRRSVWTVTTKPFKQAHFATFPEDLILPCVLAGCPQGGVILDPFFGAGTTGVVAKKNNRNYIGIELNPKYIEMAQARIDNTMGVLI